MLDFTDEEMKQKVASHGTGWPLIHPLGQRMTDKHCGKSCRGDGEQDWYFSAPTALKEEEIEIKQICGVSGVSARNGETVGEASNLVEGPRGWIGGSQTKILTLPGYAA